MLEYTADTYWTSYVRTYKHTSIHLIHTGAYRHLCDK